MKEKMVFAPASVLFLLFVFLKQFYLFPSGGMGAADVCLLLSFFYFTGWMLEKEGTNRTGSGRWFFLCVFAVCDRD